MDRGANLYGYRWEKARKLFLREHPLCAMCAKRGVIAAAHIVDHIIPHKGDYCLFWDTTNWQPLCRTCHNASKQLQERSGFSPAANEAGIPIDDTHPWNSRR